LAIGISLLTGQKNTFAAWASNNDAIDQTFWFSSPTSGQIIDALFGDGNT